MIVLKFDLGHMTLPVSPSIFTVSRLNQTVRQLLEMEMGQIWLSAEISNLSQPASGHWYFTLKDDRASALRDVPQQQPPRHLPAAKRPAGSGARQHHAV